MVALEGMERGAGAGWVPLCLGGVSMIAAEVALCRDLLRCCEELLDDEGIFLWRDDTGVEGAIGWLEESVGRGAGRFGTRKRPLPLPTDDDG